MSVSSYSFAEGQATRKADLQPVEEYSQDEIMHIHNVMEPTAAGIPEGETYVVHEEAMESDPHAHKAHPHTVQGSERHGMTASEYKRETFGNNN